MSCAGDPSAEAGEGVEDFLGGLGPDERRGVLVPVLDPAADVGFECLDVLVCASADQLVGQKAEPPLDLVDPGRAGRGEVQMETGVFGLWVP